MNQPQEKGVTTARRYDFSHGSTNPYEISNRHGLVPPCLHCGASSVITLDGSEYFAYFNRGMSINQAFPTLTAEQRELLISGIHPECWADFMGPEPDDEDDE